MSIKGKPLINGTAYTHSDIIMNVLGIPIIEVTDISYSDPQEMTLNYGTGNQPTSRGFGAVQPTASITISKKELDKIRAAAPGGRIQNIPDFPIGINYLPESGEFTRDRLNRCRFKGQDVSSSQGNSNVLITLELSVVSVDYGVN